MGLYLLFLPHDVAWNLFAGTAAGYVSYDLIHYYTHHFKPHNRLGRWLRAYHLQHHHGHEHKRYGVSSPLWDFVFATFLAPVQVASRAK